MIPTLSVALRYASWDSTTPASTSSISASFIVTMPSRREVWSTDGSWKVLPSRMRFDTDGVESMISRAATRPPPIFLHSTCEITPFSDSESITRICACLSGGNWSMTRSTVLTAVDV